MMYLLIRDVSYYAPTDVGEAVKPQPGKPESLYDSWLGRSPNGLPGGKAQTGMTDTL